MTCEKKVKRWYFVCYDQLNHEIFPWSKFKREETGLIFIESKLKGSSKNYHKQKLAFLLSNMRHFASESEDLGHPIRYYYTNSNYFDTLEKITQELGQINLVEPAERSMRIEIEPLIKSGQLLIKESLWLVNKTRMVSRKCWA